MTSTPDDDASPLEVVRHAERLVATTVQRPIARAVLRKRIVTRQQTITVELRHEEAELDIVAPDPGSGSTSGAHAALPEMVLYEERIEIVRHLVPVERVRLEIDRITTVRTITDTVGHEVVDLTSDVAASDMAPPSRT